MRISVDKVSDYLLIPDFLPPPVRGIGDLLWSPKVCETWAVEKSGGSQKSVAINVAKVVKDGDLRLNRRELSRKIQQEFGYSIPVSTFNVMAHRGVGPIYTKIGGRPSYLWSDVCAWIKSKSNPQQSVSENNRGVCA